MATKEQIAKFHDVYTAAKQAGAAHPEVIAAQWAVESGWGSKPSGKNNLFGIKAGNGDPNNKEKGTVILTTEEINGKKVKMPQKFRDYDSIEQSIADRIKFTEENPRYRKSGYFDASSPFEAAMALEKAGYATGSGYGKLLSDVIKSAGIDPMNGQQYDYSTTKPAHTALQYIAPNAPLTTFTTEEDEAYTAPAQTDLTPAFTELNSTINAFAPPETLTDFQPPEQPDYSEKLAAAFGITPSTKGKIPPHIDDMIRSIYEQTA